MICPGFQPNSRSRSRWKQCEWGPEVAFLVSTIFKISSNSQCLPFNSSLNEMTRQLAFNRPSESLQIPVQLCFWFSYLTPQTISQLCLSCFPFSMTNNRESLFPSQALLMLLPDSSVEAVLQFHVNQEHLTQDKSETALCHLSNSATAPKCLPLLDLHLQTLPCSSSCLLPSASLHQRLPR